METIALAHPDVTFSLASPKENLFEVFAQGKRERIEAILGPFQEVISQENHRSLSLWGLLGGPQEAKRQRRGQFFFVNRRSVFSPLIAKAVQAGYGTRLAEGLFPPFVLFLSIDPQEIDVNVHPQKKEVRFHQEGRLFRVIEEAVSATFFSSPSFTTPLSFSPSSALFSLEERREEEAFFPLEPSPSLPFAFPEKPLFVFQHYFFLQQEALLLVDLRRALIRIVFESLTARTSAAQTLLLPIEGEMDEEELMTWQAMGIEGRLIGKRRVAIEALPPEIEPGEFFHFVSLWREERQWPHTVRRLIFGRKKIYALEEAFAIWKRLCSCLETQVDPEGEKIWRVISSSELERLMHG